MKINVTGKAVTMLSSTVYLEDMHTTPQNLKCIHVPMIHKMKPSSSQFIHRVLSNRAERNICVSECLKADQQKLNATRVFK